MRRIFLPLLAVVLAPWASAHGAPKEPGLGFAYYENPQTLSGVAAKFKLSVKQIARLNGIKDPHKFNRHGLVLPDVPSTRALPRYVPWVKAKARSTCPVTSWKLVSARENGCEDAFCGAGPEGAHACVCRDAQGALKVVVKTSNQTLRLPVEISAFNPWGSSFVDIASADLDGDGTNEVLLSTLWAVSNGLGEEFRDLVVVREGKEWFRYDSGAFTANTALVRVGQACHLASAHWEEATHPLKGAALHLVERTFDPTNLRVDHEITGRRAGEQQRYELPFDPLVPRTLPTQSGTVVAMRQADHQLGIEIRVGQRTRALHDVLFGDAESRHLLPLGFVPSQMPKGKLLVDRSNEHDILWLP